MLYVKAVVIIIMIWMVGSFFKNTMSQLICIFSNAGHFWLMDQFEETIQWLFWPKKVSFHRLWRKKKIFQLLSNQSLGSHLDCQAKSLDTIMKEDRQGSVIFKFGLNWKSSSWEDRNVKSKRTTKAKRWENISCSELIIRDQKDIF